MSIDAEFQVDPVALQEQHEGLDIEADFPSPISKTADVHRRKKTYVLIFGPSGAGKSSLVNAVCDEQVPVALPGSGLCTTSFRYKSFILEEHEIRLIDSPGFNTPSLTSFQILKRFVEFLWKMHHKITGAIYLHPEGSDLNCDNLKQTINALSFLLGNPWLPRLKIAVLSNNADRIVHESTIRSLQEFSSPFRTVHSAGAKISALTLDPQSIRNFLLEYTLIRPELLRVQTKVFEGQSRNLSSHIGHALKYQAQESTSSRLPRSDQNTRHNSIKQELVAAADTSKQLELALAESETEVKSLRDQLEHTRSEYASLRSELQLRDNMEQSTVINSLKALNRSIEDFGRSLAEYLVDNYIVSNPDDATTLKASNLSELKVQFGHRENTSSLVLSSLGDGLVAEDFFDLATRSILCKRIHNAIFLPFHPTLANSPNNEFMAEIYKEIQGRESQTSAAKWRASAYLALSKQNSPDIRAQVINRCISQMVATDLNPLFKNFFDEQAAVALTELQLKALENTVSLAWDWNHVIKGTVITLGDFQPMIHDDGSVFDLQYMVDFESSRKAKPTPETAICTVALGLTVASAKKKGDPLDNVVVRKASVVTEQVYN